MKKRHWLNWCLQVGLLGFLGWLSVSVFACKTLAQNSPSNIVPDKTLGAESSFVISDFAGKPIEVIIGGASRGINLFHSFQEFNVASGRGAYFFSPNANIQNILARVTGKNPSKILGTLGAYGNSEPNLYLINPNGIVFEENASLDVNGSFVATTANAIQFGERWFFSATNPENPQLLTINPSAFLFNQISTQGITSQSTQALLVPEGQSLLLLGGDVNLNGGLFFALGGRVELGGLSTSGIVRLNADGSNLSLRFSDNVNRANVFLANQAFVSVAGEGGNITVNARNLNMTQQSIMLAGIVSDNNLPNSKAGDIEINATDAISLSGGSNIISTVASLFKGNAGNIRLNATNIVELGTTPDGQIRSGINTSTFGDGAAGNLTITTGKLVAENALIGAGTSRTGRGGSITVNATDSVELRGTNLTTSSFSDGAAKTKIFV